MTLYLKGHGKHDKFNLKHLNLLKKTQLFQLQLAVFSMPLEVERYTVPHLKAIIGGKMENRGLRCGSILILWYPLCKIALLVHTGGLGRFVSLSTVDIH